MLVELQQMIISQLNPYNITNEPLRLICYIDKFSTLYYNYERN